MQEEILDIVDSDENVIGQIARKDSQRVITENLGFIRVVDLFLLNTEGQVWIPTRTADKVIAPEGYDFSAAGHVESGESYLQTVIREAKEEINLDINEDSLEFIANTTYTDRAFKQDLYLFRTDITPTFNTDDFTTAQWFTLTQLVNNIDNGHAAKSHLKNSVRLLRDYLAKKGSLNSAA